MPGKPKPENASAKTRERIKKKNSELWYAVVKDR